MTISEPYRDPSHAHKNNPDWLVTVRGESQVQTERFDTEAAAWKFYDAANGPADDAGPSSCPWLVEVPSNNPEPDFPEDLVSIVECGAEVTVNEHGSWRCAAGHEHVSYDDPARSAHEAELAYRERLDG
jgi:hypothetical protein